LLGLLGIGFVASIDNSAILDIFIYIL